MSKTIILLITFATIIIAVGVYLYTVQTKQAGIACTMEAKLCPDGSYVGRTGPDCESRFVQTRHLLFLVKPHRPVSIIISFAQLKL